MKQLSEKLLLLKKWRLRLDKYYPTLLVLLSAYFIADLIVISYRDLMLPQKPPVPRKMQNRLAGYKAPEFYNSIIARNIFSSDGLIPDALVSKDDKNKPLKNDEPVLSSLPLNLVGTIVHSNPKKSIANIELKSKNLVASYTPDKEIEKIANLVSVERFKVVIRNTNNGRLEYLEMKSAMNKLSFGSGASKLSPPSGTLGGGKDVKVIGENKFEINKSDLDKYLSDLGSILQDAAMVEQKKPNGETCFKFLSIKPGSVYTQLGLQVGDCLKSVNGEKIDSAAKGMELFQAMKSANEIKIMTEREGRDQQMDYTIRK